MCPRGTDLNMPNHRVALLSNPASTRNLKNINRMRRTVAAGKNILHVELDGIASMAEALRQIARYDPTVLVISGGDGTVQATLTSLSNENPFKELPPIAVLPSGKTNLIATDLGMSGRPQTLFNDIVALARSEKFRRTFVKRLLAGGIKCSPPCVIHRRMARFGLRLKRRASW